MAANSYDCHEVCDSVHGTMKSFTGGKKKAEQAKNRAVHLEYQAPPTHTHTRTQMDCIIKPQSFLCSEVCGSVVGVAKSSASILCFSCMLSQNSSLGRSASSSKVQPKRGGASLIKVTSPEGAAGSELRLHFVFPSQRMTTALNI